MIYMGPEQSSHHIRGRTPQCFGLHTTLPISIIVFQSNKDHRYLITHQRIKGPLSLFPLKLKTTIWSSNHRR